MIRGLLTILLCLMVTTVLFVEAGMMLFGPEGRVNEWLQVLVARQLADTLGRQVRVGPVEAEWLTRAVARDVAVAEGKWLADGEILRIRRLALDYDLIAILRQEVAPAAALDRVVVEGAWAGVVRDARRVINFTELLPRRAPVRPEDAFQGLIEVIDSEISYTDYAAYGKDGSPLTLELAGLTGTVDMRRLSWVQVQAQCWERLGRLAYLRADVEGQPGKGVWWIDGDITGANLPWWYDFVLNMPGIDLDRGVADVAGTLALGPRPDGSRGAGLTGDARVSGATLRFAALNNRPIDCDIEGGFSLKGMQVRRLDARVEGAQVRAQGTLADFGSPCLDVSFEAEAARPARLTSLAPSAASYLEGVEVDGPLVVRGTLVGPVESANLEADVMAPGEVAFAAGNVSAQARNMTTRVSLLNLARPSVWGRATVAGLAVDDVAWAGEQPVLDWGGGQATLPDLPGPLRMAPLEDVAAEVLWAQGTAVGQTRLHVPHLSAGDIEVSNLSADAALAGSALSVRQARFEALGADVAAEGVVDLAAEDGIWAYFAGDLDGLDLGRVDAALQELPGAAARADAQPLMLGGTASGSFAGTWAAGEPQIAVVATVDRPRYADTELEDLRLLAEVDGDGVQLHAARFAHAAGVGWAQGTVPWEGDIAGRFALGAVDLAELAAAYGAEELRGEVWVDGAISGSADDPQIELGAQAFAPGWGEYQADAALLRAHGGLYRLEVDDLYASSGRVTASLDGTITPEYPEEVHAETLVDLVAALQALTGMDGAIDGRLRLGGPMDAHGRELAGIEDLDVEGAVRVEARLGGTLSRPAVAGQLFTRYGRYDTVATDAAIMQVRLEGDVLEMDRMVMQVGDAVLQGEASITSLYDEPIVSARLSANDVLLQDLELWRNIGLPLSGRVSLPYLSVQGPLDNLKGLAQVEAEDLVLGDERIGGVAAWVVLDDQSLILRRTTLALAGGELSLEGQYRLLTHEILPSRVELAQVSIPRLLAVARPVAETFAAAPAQGMSLADRLGSLSMRLGGTADGSISLAGLLPEAAEPGADPARRPTMKQILQQIALGIELQVADVSYDRRDLPDLKLDAHVTEQGEVELALDATEGEALIAVDGTWDPDGQVDMLGEVYALDVAAAHKWMPPVVRSLGGQLNLSVQATGRDVAPDLLGSLDVIQPEVHGVRFDLISAPIIRVADGHLDVDSLVLRAQDQEIFVNGQIPLNWGVAGADSFIALDEELSVVARTENTNLGIFPPMLAGLLDEHEQTPLSRLSASGTVNSRIEMTGTLRHPQLLGQLRVADGALALPSLSKPIEDIQLEARFSPEGGETLLQVEHLGARAAQVALEGAGEGRLTYFSLPKLHLNSYDFAATVSAPQQEFGGGLSIADLGGGLALHTEDDGRQVVTIDGLGAKVGEGRISLSGDVELVSFVPSEVVRNSYDLTLTVDRARPKYSNIFLGTVDGVVRATTPVPGQPVLISGAVAVSHARVGMPPPSRQVVPQLTGMPEWFPAPSFDLTLGVGQDVEFKTTGITAPLEPSASAVTMTGTPQRPVVLGTIEVQEGRASVPAGALDVGAAGVQFTVQPAPGTGQSRPPVPLTMDGRVWGTATKRITDAVVGGRDLGTLDVLLEVSGTLPDQVEVRASSIPPLAEEQIYGLLGAQELMGGFGGDGGEALSDVMSRRFMDALGAAFRYYLFQPFAEDLKRMLGLSMLEVSFAYDHPVQIRVGKYLIENLLVTYEAKLGSEDEWEAGISYRVSNTYAVSFQTNHLNNSRLLIEYVQTF